MAKRARVLLGMFKPLGVVAALAFTGLTAISGANAQNAETQNTGPVAIAIPALQTSLSEPSANSSTPVVSSDADAAIQKLMPGPAEPPNELTVVQEALKPSLTDEETKTALPVDAMRKLMPAPATPPMELAIEKETPAAETDQAISTASITKPLEAPAPPQATPVSMPAPALAPAAPAEQPKVEQPTAKVSVDVDQMRQAIEQWRGHSRLPPKETAALADFYTGREMAPLWLGETGWRTTARAAGDRLAQAAEDGLKAARYNASLPTSTDGGTLAAADIAFSEAVVLYGRDARGARINPLRVSSLITATPTIPGVGEILAAVSNAGDANAALHDFNPSHAGYVALRQKLAEMRKVVDRPAPIQIPPGPVLRIGMQDARVPLLRKRLDLPASDDVVFDQAVSDAVASFQKTSGIAGKGVLNRATTLALSAETGISEAEIIANMERWRWLPRELGERYVMVNIPEYMLRLMQDGAAIHSARVVVGKTDSQTPVFSNRMEYLVVNPSWNVPPSILKKEFLPKLALDPDYAAKKGFEVIHHGNQISIRQPPGERNALGHIKFMFPNQHAVYIHDTPSRGLFANASRAYSHGCVRVQDPFHLGETVLGADNGWNEQRIRSLIGHGERQIKLKQTLPVHLTYFTTWVDEAGVLQSRNDLYGHSRRVQAMLGAL